MCLILFAYREHPDYPLVLAANRDELYDRPSEPAHFWKQAPQVLAGRDRKEGGTWLGLTRTGRIAAITNARGLLKVHENAPSRGALVRDFLTGQSPPGQYLETVQQVAKDYNGFNLIAGDREGLFFLSNQNGGLVQLEPGFYGLSNALLDTPWPKVERGKQGLRRVMERGPEPDLEALFALLRDPYVPPDPLLPASSLGLEWDRIVAPIFITSPTYGTRCSTVVTLSRDGNAVFEERTFSRPGDAAQVGPVRKFRIQMDPRTAWSEGFAASTGAEGRVGSKITIEYCGR